MRQKYDLDIGMPRPPLGLADKPWDDAKVRAVLNLVDGD